jgi:maltose alpha-D-glucosyltransferase/alpha-amylase
MQWTASENAGFSKAPLVEPAPVKYGEYAAERVNVADQELRSGSLLSRVSQLVRGRRALGALPMDRCQAVDFEPRSVFGVLHRRDDDAVLMLANLGADEVELRLPYEVKADLLADANYELASMGAVRLNGYGYRWIACMSPRVAGKPDL